MSLSLQRRVLHNASLNVSFGSLKTYIEVIAPGDILASFEEQAQLTLCSVLIFLTHGTEIDKVEVKEVKKIGLFYS